MFENLMWRIGQRVCPLDTSPDRRSGFLPYAKISRLKAAPTNCHNSLFKQALAILSLSTCLTGCLDSEPVAKEVIKLRLDAPSAGWNAEPLEAWETNDTLFCLFQLSPPDGMAAQVITTIESKMRLPESEKAKQIVVLGKTWNWSPSEPIAFPESRESFLASLPENASRVEIERNEP
jgi:hypothetical protein